MPGAPGMPDNGQWTFGKRNEAGLTALKQKIAEEL
jgi:hypothetical protein